MIPLILISIFAYIYIYIRDANMLISISGITDLYRLYTSVVESEIYITVWSPPISPIKLTVIPCADNGEVLFTIELRSKINWICNFPLIVYCVREIFS